MTRWSEDLCVDFESIPVTLGLADHSCRGAAVDTSAVDDARHGHSRLGGLRLNYVGLGGGFRLSPWGGRGSQRCCDSEGEGEHGHEVAGSPQLLGTAPAAILAHAVDQPATGLHAVEQGLTKIERAQRLSLAEAREQLPG